MNLPNKITMCRIFLSITLLVILMFPYDACGIAINSYKITPFGIPILIEFLVAGVIFLVASLTDFLDGNIARKRGLVTNFGKVMDAIADKILVNGVLIILANHGLPVIIPVVIITRDIFVDSIKMVAGSNGKAVGASILGKLKTICMMSGLTLFFFGNFPFELINLPIDKGLIYLATILSVVSGIQYYQVNKEAFKEK